MKNLNPKNYLIRNDKGIGLLSVLIAASIGVVALAGLSKLTSGLAERTNNIAHKREVMEIKSNVINILRSHRAWSSSSNYKPKSQVDEGCLDCNPTEKCFPGTFVKSSSTDTSGPSCPMNFWYNPKNPNTQAAYNNDADLVRWISAVKNSEYTGSTSSTEGEYHGFGLGFITPSGTPIDLSSCDEDNPEDCVAGRNYIKVKIMADPMVENNSTPTFKVNIIDLVYTKHVTSINVRAPVVEEYNTGPLLYSQYIPKAGPPNRICTYDIDGEDLKPIIMNNCEFDRNNIKECYAIITRYDDNPRGTVESYTLRITYYKPDAAYGILNNVVAFEKPWSTGEDEDISYDDTSSHKLSKDDWRFGEVRTNAGGGGFEDAENELNFCAQRNNRHTVIKILKK